MDQKHNLYLAKKHPSMHLKISMSTKFVFPDNLDSSWDIQQSFERALLQIGAVHSINGGQK